MTNAQTIKTALTSAATLLNTEEAALEAQLLLQHVLNVNRAWLIMHENDALQPNIHAGFEALLKRRLNGEPIAYILGYREFYGLKLKVTADTLIPRADTETLVEAALARIVLSPLPRGERGRGESANNLDSKPEIASLRSQRLGSPSPASGRESDDALARIPAQNSITPSFRREQFAKLRTTESSCDETDSDLRQNDKVWNELKILDLGTGTGAIALAIAHNRPQAFVTAVDASEGALKIAQENAQNLNITNIKFMQSDWFSKLQNETFDMIVSNPPYIAQNDAHLTQGDLRFEPLAALASGADGLDDIKRIITNAPKHLNPHGVLLLEHGYNQANEVTALLKEAGFNEIETMKDLGGNNRVTLGHLA